jgi:dienelactone hydrolase
VVFSHGFGGFRTQSSELTAAIASWGFVVAAPDHPRRNLTRVLFGPPGTTTDLQDLDATLTMMGRKTGNPASAFHRHVDMTHVGAVGHSAGGLAVENLAVTDKRVDTFVGMAGASKGALDEEASKVPRKPGLLLAATADGIVALDQMDQAYDAMKKPKRIVYFGGFGHLAFSDMCEIGESDGGLLAIADLLGIPVSGQLATLATDGCLDPTLDPTLAWPAIQHVVVAHLRRVFGIDTSDSALTGLVEAYPAVVSGARSAQ